MSDAHELVETYVSLWNESDARTRREKIAALWAEDGAHFTKTMAARGYDEIESRVAAAHARFVGTGKYVFRAIDNIDSHHDTVRFNWTMVPAEGGDVEAVGFEFLVLAPDGRIRADYHFIEQ